MACIQGEGRSQGTLFPVVLDQLVPADQVCRVVDASVGTLAMTELVFERSIVADTGRPGYDPRDLLNLCLFGYLNQIRSLVEVDSNSRELFKSPTRLTANLPSQRNSTC